MIRGVMEAVLYCPDLEAAKAFYGGVLQLEQVTAQEGRHVFYACGRNRLLLFDPAGSARTDADVDGQPVPPHGTAGPGHVALVIRDEEIDGWEARFKELGIAIESLIIWPQGGRSIYVRDPANNSVELISPRVWGEPEW